jgi:CheY-like chemotaxis protein
MTRPYTDDAIRLLGGAVRIRTRVRGFALWSPHGATLQLLEQVRAVLVEYEDHLPLTIRQIFYRLVGAYNYEKTERAYARLCEYLPDLILMDIQLPIMDFDCRNITARRMLINTSLHLTAEGVETPDQHLFLRAAGVHSMQGYRFGRPVTAPEIDHRLAAPEDDRLASPDNEIAIAG